MKAKIICPKCGKPALNVRYYKDGDACFIHKQKSTQAGIFQFVDATEYCYIKGEKNETPR